MPAFFTFLAVSYGGFLTDGVVSAESLPAVVIDDEESPCAEEFTSRLVEELSLRSSAELYSSTSVERGDTTWTLTFDRVEDHACRIRLAGGEKSTTFVLQEGAEQLEFVSIVTRIVWIIEGIDGSAAIPQEELVAQPQPKDTEEIRDEQSSPGDAWAVSTDDQIASTGADDGEPSKETVKEVPVALSMGDMTSQTGDRAQSGTRAESGEEVRTLMLPASSLSSSRESRSPGIIEDKADTSEQIWLHDLSFDAVGGAVWTPTVENSSMMVGARLNWQAWDRVSFGFAGRLPIGESQWESGDFQYSYRSWSADLTASYLHQISPRWRVSAGTGIRRTGGHFSAVQLAQQQANTESPANNSQEQIDTGRTNDETQSQYDESDSVDGGESQGQDDSYAHDGSQTAEEQEPSTNGNNDSDPATDESSFTMESPLSRWSVVATMGGSYSLTKNLAIGVEATAATSLADRYVSRDGRVVADLGRFEFDLLMGLELRF